MLTTIIKHLQILISILLQTEYAERNEHFNRSFWARLPERMNTLTGQSANIIIQCLDGSQGRAELVYLDPWLPQPNHPIRWLAVINCWPGSAEDRAWGRAPKIELLSFRNKCSKFPVSMVKWNGIFTNQWLYLFVILCIKQNTIKKYFLIVSI